MSRARRLTTLILAALLALAGAGWASRSLAAQEPGESPAPESEEASPGAEESVAEPDPSDEPEREEAAPPAEAPEESSEEASQEAEPERPEIPKRLPLAVPAPLRAKVEVVLVADAECRVSAGGQELGVLPANEKRRVTLGEGDHWVKARSVEHPAAAWDRVITVRPGDTRVVEIKMEKAIRDLQREERHSKIYRDSKTDLMWSRRDNGTDVRWEQAAEYCTELSLGGYEDWRQPTLEELRSIRSLWSQATFKVEGQILLTGCCPWSADVEADGDRAWNFNFVHRRPFLGHVAYSYGGRALCVRTVTEEDELDRQASEAEEDSSEPGEGFEP